MNSVYTLWHLWHCFINLFSPTTVEIIKGRKYNRPCDAWGLKTRESKRAAFCTVSRRDMAIGLMFCCLQGVPNLVSATLCILHTVWHIQPPNLAFKPIWGRKRASARRSMLHGVTCLILILAPCKLQSEHTKHGARDFESIEESTPYEQITWHSACAVSVPCIANAVKLKPS